MAVEQIIESTKPCVGGQIKEKVIASSLAQMATLRMNPAGTMQAASGSLSLNSAVHVVSAVMPLKQH